MEIVEKPKSDLYFLKGGGEMGAMMRSYDWSSTSVGDPENWPIHLRNAVNLILSSKFPMFIWWGEDLVQFYNDAYRPSFGNEGKHPVALGQKGKECWPEIWDIIYPLIEKVLTTGEGTWQEDQLIPIYRNGGLEDVYWTFSYSAIRGESEQIDGILVVCHETTGSVQSHKKLQKSEEQIRSLVESAPFPIGVYYGREMRIGLANQTIIDVWGKGNDVIGKLYSDILPELENQEIFKQLDAVYTTGEPLHMKNQYIQLIVNGEPVNFYFDYSFTPLKNSDGEIYGVMNTAGDVTEVNTLMKKLEKSEQNLRNTILQAPVAMSILYGPEHVVQLANERMYELWGKPAKELLNKPIFEGLYEARSQGFEELLNGVYKTGEAFCAHGVPVTLPRNGKVQVAYITFLYAPYREPDGSVSGVLVVAMDVTEQIIAKNKIEEVVMERTKELAATNVSLRKSNAELEQFAYIASHDLQEPLRKISTYTQMVNQSLGKVDEKSAGYLSKISNASGRMTTLIRDVLTYSKLSDQQSSFEEVDLNKILDSIKTDYEVLIEQKKAVIKSSGLGTITAIPLQMSQLFANLISNSLKYSRKDLVPEIVINSRQLTDQELAENKLLNPKMKYIKIEFSDNGIGFKEQYGEQIFSIFQRLHRNNEYAGNGIGLAMCKKIAENHHGLIYAKPGKEQGAVFTVILPIDTER